MIPAFNVLNLFFSLSLRICKDVFMMLPNRCRCYISINLLWDILFLHLFLCYFFYFLIFYLLSLTDLFFSFLSDPWFLHILMIYSRFWGFFHTRSVILINNGPNYICTAIDNYSVHVPIQDLVYQDYLQLSRCMHDKILQ